MENQIKLTKKLVLNTQKIAVLDEKALSTIRGGVGSTTETSTNTSCSNSMSCISCVKADEMELES